MKYEQENQFIWYYANNKLGVKLFCGIYRNESLDNVLQTMV